jgi:hypothetical protein
MKNRTTESYVTLSKGFQDYQGSYSHAAINLYIYILQTVSWNSNSADYGSAIYDWITLRNSISVSTPTLRKVLNELSTGYKLPGLSRNGRPAPAFIRATELGKTKGKRVHIRVLKPKLRPQDFNARNEEKKRLDPRKKTGLKRAIEGVKQKHIEDDIDSEIKKLLKKTSKMMDMNNDK